MRYSRRLHRTGLFAPLIAGKRLLGVFMVPIGVTQCLRRNVREIDRPQRSVRLWRGSRSTNAAAYNVVEAARRQSGLQEQELRRAAVAF